MFCERSLVHLILQSTLNKSALGYVHYTGILSLVHLLPAFNIQLTQKNVFEDARYMQSTSNEKMWLDNPVERFTFQWHTHYFVSRCILISSFIEKLKNSEKSHLHYTEKKNGERKKPSLVISSQRVEAQ